MAYAAVISLQNTIHRFENLIINSPRITNAACDEELDSLISMLEKLDDESSRMIDRSVINEVDAKIRDAVWKIEDVLDISSYQYSLNISPSQGGLEEKGEEEEINSFSKTVKMREDYYRELRQKPLPPEDEDEELSLSAAEEEEEEEEDEALSLSAAVPPVNNSPSQGLDKKGVKKEMNSFLKKVKMLKKDVKQKMNSFLKKVKILREEYDRALSLSAAEEEEEEEALSLSAAVEALSLSAAVPPVNNSTTVEEEELSLSAAEEEEEEDEALSLSGAVPPVNNSPSQGLDEKGVEEEMNSFLKTVKMLREEYDRALQKPLPAEEEEDDEALSLSAAVPPVNNSTTVGLSDLSLSIIIQLLNESHFNFVSVVGMAGIGKTHLAALIYHHPFILPHFPVRVWVRAGPKYQASDIYADILSQLLHEPRDLFKGLSEKKLIDLIGSCLISGQRYLIVLDDIWTTRVVHYLRRIHFSNIQFLITTRLQEVARYQYSPETVHQMPFLNDEESWNLLRKNVFVAENSCPPQLERAGRKIADKCEGLPLLILEIADILRGLEKTEEYWMKVAENKTTTFTDAYEKIYEVLLSSYEYLPQRLKPCFLYMGVFPQTCQIRSSKLINLWAVEDFLERKLEDFAITCVEDLVSNSLAIVCKLSFLRKVRKIKSLKLHCAYWYVCVKEARKSNFLHVLNKLTDVSKDHIEKQRRLSVQNNILLGLKEVYDAMAAAVSTTRSLLCTGEDHQYPVPICFDMMLLMRVLDALAICFYEFPDEVLKLLQLRYLSLTHNGELPSSINKLQQLQCLILRRHHNIKFLKAPTTYLPDEIWDMEELRHLRIMGSNLPDPSEGKKLSKLSTLYVNAHSCSEAVFRGIPDLKNLGITIELEPDAAAETVRCLEHIKLLNRLKSVKCVVVNPRLKSSQLAVAPPDHLSKLPRWSLKQLSLNGLGYPWEYMSVIASLPFLQVLKLRCSAFQGPHWKTEAGRQFESLEFLLLEDINLVHWTAEDNSFPNLNHLSVRHCYKLKKIPSRIGHIRRLQMMEVDDCSRSVVASAQQIKEETYSDDLKVVINSSWNL